MPQPKTTETRAYLYNIVYEPAFLHGLSDTPPDAVEKLNAYHPLLEEDPAGCIPELMELCRQYPAVPQFKNYLCVAYQYLGNKEKATEVNDWTMREHPDYLFAKLYKAYEYISINQHKKVLELLGPWLEIKELYPERDIFHAAEILAFYKLAFHYHLAMDNFEIARSQLQMMDTVDPDHPDTKSIRMRILLEEANIRRKDVLDNSRKDMYSFARPKKRKG